MCWAVAAVGACSICLLSAWPWVLNIEMHLDSVVQAYSMAILQSVYCWFDVKNTKFL